MARAAVVQVAWPEVRGTAEQSVVPPSVKVTVPVGARGVLGVTVAVKVTDSPKTEDATEGVTVVVLVAWTAVPARCYLMHRARHVAAIVSHEQGRRKTTKRGGSEGHIDRADTAGGN